MRLKHMLGLAALALTTQALPVTAHAHELVDQSKVTPLMQQALTAIPGKVGSMLIVEYGPGGETGKHRHPGAYTFVYVLEGELEMQVEGKELVKLSAGQTYFETPDDVHAVSRNASDSKPARFLVVFVQDEGKPPLEQVQ